jgi:hypothetical protein
VCDADGNPILSEVDEEANELVDRIENYLSDKRAIISPMEDVISIQRIQNIFSPEYPSKVRVLDALTSLGEVWYQSDDDGKYYVELY